MVLAPTLITTTLFNAILNPYAGKRPKNPEKVYDMKTMFETIVREHPRLPTRVRRADNAGRFVESVEISEVYACLPGGRGCVGRERMGKKLLDRQVAVYGANGVKTNPRYDRTLATNYGFLNIVGKIHYTDGKESVINIPVEPSGVVGLRTGASSMALIDPTKANQNDTRGNNLFALVKEIQDILFSVLGIVSTSKPTFGMINGTFNIYTNEKKQMRPRMNNFVHVAKQVQKQPRMASLYQKAAMPWLKVQQHVPAVMKAIYKPLSKLDVGKNHLTSTDDLPTLSLSPYGHVEVLGAKSISSMIQAYNVLMDSLKHVDISVSVPEPSPPKPSKAKKPKPTTQRVNASLVMAKRGSVLMINQKECTSLPKPLLSRIVSSYGLPVKGTKKTLCERLIYVFNSTI